MTQTYIEHRAIEGERWDQIAWHYYGDAARMPDLLAANPAHAHRVRLPATTLIKVPVIVRAKPSSVGLPPWKR